MNAEYIADFSEEERLETEYEKRYEITLARKKI